MLPVPWVPPAAREPPAPTVVEEPPVAFTPPPVPTLAPPVDPPLVPAAFIRVPLSALSCIVERAPSESSLHAARNTTAAAAADAKTDPWAITTSMIGDLPWFNNLLAPAARTSSDNFRLFSRLALESPDLLHGKMRLFRFGFWPGG